MSKPGSGREFFEVKPNRYLSATEKLFGNVGWAERLYREAQQTQKLKADI